MEDYINRLGMRTSINFLERFQKETMYLWNDEKETYVKSTPEGATFAKLPGGKEFEIKRNSDLFFLAVNEVTQEEYDNA